MDCPRCGGEFVEYTLDGSRAVVCDACGYVDVAADHRGEREPRETWPEAVRRYRERRRREALLQTGVRIAVDGTTYLVDPGVGERYDALTEKQRAIVDRLVGEPDPTDPDRTHAEIGESAGAHASYVGDVIRRYGDLALEIARGEVVEGEPRSADASGGGADASDGRDVGGEGTDGDGAGGST